MRIGSLIDGADGDPGVRQPLVTVRRLSIAAIVTLAFVVNAIIHAAYMAEIAPRLEKPYAGIGAGAIGACGAFLIVMPFMIWHTRRLARSKVAKSNPPDFAGTDELYFRHDSNSRTATPGRQDRLVVKLPVTAEIPETL
jgi:hypothetical protein